MFRLYFPKQQTLVYMLGFLMTFSLPSLVAAQSPDSKKQYDIVCVGFYNIENLFDTLDTPNVSDEEFTPAGAKKWNSEKYHQKLQNNARVIQEMGAGYTPDGLAVLGLCELENKTVLEDLIHTDALKQRNYQIVHYDSPDKRGVDVAFIYQTKYFTVTSSKSYTLRLQADSSWRTRDQLLVSGELLGERIHYIVCHWPSRSGGEKESEHLRVAASGLTSSIIDSLSKADPKAKIVLMGDLNDNPDNVSITQGINAVSTKDKLKKGQMFNASESTYKSGAGTLTWRGNWFLFDQMIMNKQLTKKCGAKKSFRFHKFSIFDASYIREAEGKYAGHPFRTYVGNDFKGGYSDHLPVYTVLIREKK